MLKGCVYFEESSSSMMWISCISCVFILNRPTVYIQWNSLKTNTHNLKFLLDYILSVRVGISMNLSSVKMNSLKYTFKAGPLRFILRGSIVYGPSPHTTGVGLPVNIALDVPEFISSLTWEGRGSWFKVSAELEYFDSFSIMQTMICRIY